MLSTDVTEAADLLKKLTKLADDVLFGHTKFLIAGLTPPEAVNGRRAGGDIIAVEPETPNIERWQPLFRLSPAEARATFEAIIQVRRDVIIARLTELGVELV